MVLSLKQMYGKFKCKDKEFDRSQPQARGGSVKEESHLSEGLFGDLFDFHQGLRVGHLEYISTKTPPYERETSPKLMEELLRSMPGCQAVEKKC